MKTNQTRIATLISGMFAASAVWAAPSATSPYVADQQSEYVQDQTSDGIDNVNMILCIMHGMSPAAMVNAGPYRALVDMNKCDNKSRASASNSTSGASGASAAANYMNAVVDVTRASNADPMVAKVWISFTDNHDNMEKKVWVQISALQSPTDAPPYGQFRLDYIGNAANAANNANPPFVGYIDTMTAGVLKYLETGSNSSDVALALTASSTTSGAGTMTITQPAPATFNFAYDSNYFRRNAQCFDRRKANANRSVWRYGTYNANDGSRVDMVNPGFPIKATYGGTSYYGFANYYGINFQGLDLNTIPDANPIAGLTVADQRSGSTLTYNLSKVSGKLVKWTQQHATLAALDGIPFNFGGDMTGQTGNGSITGFGNWQVVWHSGTFTVVGQQTCTPGSGCVVAPVGPAVVTGSNFNAMPINGWADSFGGNLIIPPTGAAHAAGDTIYYYTQATVLPGTSVPTLYCMNNCPTAASLAAFTGSNSPYDANTTMQWFSANSANIVSYTFGSAGLMQGSTAMVLTDATKFPAGSQYQGGIMSGQLFETAFSACPNPPYAMNMVCGPTTPPAVYYNWQTGPNPWDQTLWLTNTANSQVVSLDPPVNIPYTVTSSDDPSGTWVGKTIMLQFNGFGNLWGIPGYCVSPTDNTPAACGPNVRYVPAFALADGASMTLPSPSTPLLVKGLEAELRLAGVPLTTCTTAPENLTLTSMTPPSGGTVDASAAIGLNPPAVTVNGGAPKVIDGVVQ